MSLMTAMQLGILCPEVGAIGGVCERCSLLLFVMMLLLLAVVVDVVVVVVLKKLQTLKDGYGTGHQTCRCCLNITQLGQVTLYVWKQARGLRAENQVSYLWYLDFLP